MNTNEKRTKGGTDLTLEEKIDLILDKLDQLLSQKKALDEGPKDPPLTPPNP